MISVIFTSRKRTRQQKRTTNILTKTKGCGQTKHCFKLVRKAAKSRQMWNMGDNHAQTVHRLEVALPCGCGSFRLDLRRGSGLGRRRGRRRELDDDLGDYRQARWFDGVLQHIGNGHQVRHNMPAAPHSDPSDPRSSRPRKHPARNGRAQNSIAPGSNVTAGNAAAVPPPPAHHSRLTPTPRRHCRSCCRP